MNALSVNQYAKLRKFALLRLTTLLEKHTTTTSTLTTRTSSTHQHLTQLQNFQASATTTAASSTSNNKSSWNHRFSKNLVVPKFMKRSNHSSPSQQQQNSQPQQEIITSQHVNQSSSLSSSSSIQQQQQQQHYLQYKSKSVFGVPLALNVQRHGQPLPHAVMQIMRYLRNNSQQTIGIFRKSGSKVRMAVLREMIEKQQQQQNQQQNQQQQTEFERQLNMIGGITANHDSSTNQNSYELNSIGSAFSSKSDLIDPQNEEMSSPPLDSQINHEMTCIDLADILKQYFRELPECLFTDKLSQILIDVFTWLPSEGTERLEAVQYCMLMLDDERRDAVQCLLYFLHDVSLNSHVHKMDIKNISTCLAPTLLNMNNLKDMMPSSSSSPNNSLVAVSSCSGPTSPKTTNNSDPTHLMSRQCNASLACLSLMIENPKAIFQIPNEAYAKSQFTQADYSISLTLNELLGSFSKSMLTFFLNERIDEMAKEMHNTPEKSWTRVSNQSNEVEIFYKIPALEDDYQHLKMWKLSVELDASPSRVLDALLKQRVEWHDDQVDFRVLESLTNQTDIVQYAVHFMAPQPTRDFCELRTSREASYIDPKYSHVIFSTSIEHEKADRLIGDIRGNTLKNFYLLEPIGERKCKLHQLYRADYKGYSSDWYGKMQGFLLKRHLVNLKEFISLVNSSNSLKK